MCATAGADASSRGVLQWPHRDREEPPGLRGQGAPPFVPLWPTGRLQYIYVYRFTSTWNRVHPEHPPPVLRSHGYGGGAFPVSQVNRPDRHGATPLHLAAAEGHHHIIEMLLQGGADLRAKDHYGRTPLGLVPPGNALNETAARALLSNYAFLQEFERVVGRLLAMTDQARPLIPLPGPADMRALQDQLTARWDVGMEAVGHFVRHGDFRDAGMQTIDKLISAARVDSKWLEAVLDQ
jgi:hypothetical protein